MTRVDELKTMLWAWTNAWPLELTEEFMLGCDDPDFVYHFLDQTLFSYLEKEASDGPTTALESGRLGVGPSMAQDLRRALTELAEAHFTDQILEFSAQAVKENGGKSLLDWELITSLLRKDHKNLEGPSNDK